LNELVNSSFQIVPQEFFSLLSQQPYLCNNPADVLLLDDSDDVVDKALNLGFVADNNGLLCIQVIKNIPYFI